MNSYRRASISRTIVAAIALSTIAAPGRSFVRAQQRTPAPRTDVVYEASVRDLQAAMSSGRVAFGRLVDAYLARIRAYDHAGPALNAIVRLNPNARADAAALDAEHKAGRVRGPLHGIPIILKDNYGTRDFPTSAGTIALANMQTPDDAFQVRKLRQAGAVTRPCASRSPL